MRLIVEQILRLFSNPLLVAIGVTMIVETAIEGGHTVLWLAYTVAVAVLYVGANRLHEGTDDMVDELHDKFIEDEQ
jgi:hypothetical protein